MCQGLSSTRDRSNSSIISTASIDPGRSIYEEGERDRQKDREIEKIETVIGGNVVNRLR